MVTLSVSDLTYRAWINDVVTYGILVYFIGINYNPVFPCGFGDFAHSGFPQSSEQQQHPLDHNASGKTEYMAFPKPFESSSSTGAENQRYVLPQCNSPAITIVTACPSPPRLRFFLGTFI